MRLQTKSFLSFLILTSMVIGQAVTLRAFAQAPAAATPGDTVAGRWRVKFRFAGDVERNLIFEAKAKNIGSFLLLDTGPDDKPVLDPVPALWSQLTNDRVSFAGEAELPLGTCCREIGTLIFRGKLKPDNSISGNIIFVTSVNEEESPYKYHSLVGTFTATRSN
jgi:hypothetical protein